MRKAQITDKSLVLKIISEKYAQVPTLRFMLRDYKDPRFIRRLAQYAFDFAIRREAVYLSDNGKAVAICYWKGEKGRNLYDIYLQLRLVVSAFSLRRLPQIIKHSNEVSKHHPTDKPFLYFWFYGALAEEKQGSSARELAFGIMRIAKENNSDIYTETTMEQNKRVYERFGFTVYHESYNDAGRFPVWFMRWTHL